jgi:hypothetical protein
MAPPSFTCPRCGAQNTVEPNGPANGRCVNCGLPLPGQTVTVGTPAPPALNPISGNPLKLEFGAPGQVPGKSSVGGILSIVFGALLLALGVPCGLIGIVEYEAPLPFTGRYGVAAVGISLVVGGGLLVGGILAVRARERYQAPRPLRRQTPRSGTD